jgi:hypothetical protein
MVELSRNTLSAKKEKEEKKKYIITDSSLKV